MACNASVFAFRANSCACDAMKPLHGHWLLRRWSSSLPPFFSLPACLPLSLSLLLPPPLFLPPSLPPSLPLPLPASPSPVGLQFTMYMLTEPAFLLHIRFNKWARRRPPSASSSPSPALPLSLPLPLSPTGTTIENLALSAQTLNPKP